MSSIYRELKTVIQAKIRENYNQEITGQILQDVLISMLDYIQETENRKQELAQEEGLSTSMPMSQAATTIALKDLRNLIPEATNYEIMPFAGFIDEADILPGGVNHENGLVVYVRSLNTFVFRELSTGNYYETWPTSNLYNSSDLTPRVDTLFKHDTLYIYLNSVLTQLSDLGEIKWKEF